jgi:hypothetical protein
MVLDAADHDTWSCGSFFTNPILSAGEMDALADRVRDRLGDGAPDLPVWPEPDGRRKTSAAWLIERAGFEKGYGTPGPAALSDKHTLAVTNRGHPDPERRRLRPGGRRDRRPGAGVGPPRRRGAHALRVGLRLHLPRLGVQA